MAGTWAAKKARVDAWRLAGKCTGCGETLEAGYKTCQKCRSYYAKYNTTRVAKKRAAGQCARCQNAARPGGATCADCQLKDRRNSAAYVVKKRNAGTCRWCNSPPLPNIRSCWRCYFRLMSIKVFRTLKRGAELEAIFHAQGGRCFYTDELLIPGVNASLDHQTPPSKGGTASLDNLKWVTFKVNATKQDRTHAEFVDFCRMVVKKHGGAK